MITVRAGASDPAGAAKSPVSTDDELYVEGPRKGVGKIKLRKAREWSGDRWGKWEIDSAERTTQPMPNS